MAPRKVASLGRRARASAAGRAKQLRLGVEREPRRRQPEAALELAGGELDAARADLDLASGEQLLERREALRRGDQHQALAARARGLDLARKARQLAVEEVGRGRPEVDRAGAAGERVDRQVGAGDQRGDRRRRVLEQLGRERETLVLAPGLVLERQPLGVVLDLGAERRRVERDDDRVGERLGERRGARLEERQQVLPAGGSPPPREVAQQLDALEPRLALEERREQLGQARRRLLALGEEGERQQGRALEVGLRALALRVEGAQALELVAEQIEPQRRFRAGREQVEDAAAHREVADLGDQVDAPVAERRQPYRELAGVESVAARELDPRQPPRRGQAAEERPRRGDEGAGRPRGRAVERDDLLGAHLQRGVDRLVGGERGRREGQPGAGAREERQRLEPGPRLALVRHDHQQRPAAPLREQVGHPGRGGDRQAGRPRPGREPIGERRELGAPGQAPGDLRPGRHAAHRD